MSTRRELTTHVKNDSMFPCFWKIPLGYYDSYFTTDLQQRQTRTPLNPLFSAGPLFHWCAVPCDVSNALSSSDLCSSDDSQRKHRNFSQVWFGSALPGWVAVSGQEEQVSWSLLTSSYAGVERREPWEERIIQLWNTQTKSMLYHYDVFTSLERNSN